MDWCKLFIEPAVLLTVTQSARYQKRDAAAERTQRKAGLVDDVTGAG